MKPRHTQQLALLPVVLFAAVALCSMPLVVHAQEQKPLAFTFSGPVRGSVTSAGVREFLGIPYAAPPVGNLLASAGSSRSVVRAAGGYAVCQPLSAAAVAFRQRVRHRGLSLSQCFYPRLQRFLPPARGDGLDPWRRPRHW